MNFPGTHTTNCRYLRKNNSNYKLAHRCHEGPIFPCKLIDFWIVYIDSAAGLCILDRHVQLFREWLSEKVEATIAKGIVGGFDKQTMVREAKDVICEC